MAAVSYEINLREVQRLYREFPFLLQRGKQSAGDLILCVHKERYIGDAEQPYDFGQCLRTGKATKLVSANTRMVREKKTGETLLWSYYQTRKIPKKKYACTCVLHACFAIHTYFEMITCNCFEMLACMQLF
jgi:hypothetical protein